jgi:hypothetical protein
MGKSFVHGEKDLKTVLFRDCYQLSVRLTRKAGFRHGLTFDIRDQLSSS